MIMGVMKCISPISIKDPRKKRAAQRMVVPCGRCGACRYNRRVEWSFRLKQEERYSVNSWFITLTYSDEELPYAFNEIPSLHKADMQKFIMRVRKANKKKWPEVQLRYYAVGEYGTRTQRPHYHITFFNLHPDIVRDLAKFWKLGLFHVGDVTESSIHYVTKYHVNYDSDLEFREPEFATMSRRPGIGIQYVNRNADWNQDSGNVYVMNNGFAQRMPRYYKEKIFSPEARELLAEQGMVDFERAYWKEYNRLFDLGIKDPDAYMEKSNYLESLKVQKKANENDTF